MILSAIVAATDNDVISKEGKIPWHMPADFAHLKAITMGHPIIMGRKTHDAIGRILPGRTNIVISRDKNYQVQPGAVLVDSLDAALDYPEVKQAEEAFIFGGQSIYDQAMPLVQRIYLTRVHTVVDGDTFFRFDPKAFNVISREKHSADTDNPFDWEWLVLQRTT